MPILPVDEAEFKWEIIGAGFQWEPPLPHLQIVNLFHLNGAERTGDDSSVTQIRLGIYSMIIIVNSRPIHSLDDSICSRQTFL